MMRRWAALLPLVMVLVGPAARAEELTLVVREQHNFSRQEARVRVQQLLDYWGQRYGVRGAWEGDEARVRGQVMGVEFAARLVVRDHHVHAVTSDPGTLLRGAATDYVHRKLRKYLHPTYAER